MPNDILQEAMREAYASAPTDQVILHTLEFNHPAFKENNIQHSIRVVRDTIPMFAGLETGNHFPSVSADKNVFGDKVNGSNAVSNYMFLPFFFDFNLPEISDNNPPEITITIDNVGKQLLEYVKDASISDDLVEVIYRPYLSTDYTAPQYSPPLRLNLNRISANNSVITANSQLTNLHNNKFPRKRYTIDEFPLLLPNTSAN